MADSNYKINVDTKATGKGAEQTQEKLAALEKTAVDADSAAEALNKEIDKLGAESGDAAKALKKQADALKMVAKNARQAVDQNKQMTSTTSRLEGAQKKSNKQQKNSGQAFLELSRAAEDAQYGIRGVLNNLPQIALHMGMGAGLAGAVSLVAVGLTVLVPLLGGTKDSIKGLSEEVGQMGEVFDDLGDFSDLDDQFDDFTDSIERQKDAIDDNTARFEAHIATRQKLRKLTIEDMKVAAELEKQAIDEQLRSGAIDEPEAIRQKGAIDSRISRAQGQDKVAVAKEELAILERQAKAVQDRLAAEMESYEAAKKSNAEAEKKRVDALLMNESANVRGIAKEMEGMDLTKGLALNAAHRKIAEAFMDTDVQAETDNALLEEAKVIKQALEVAGDDKEAKKQAYEALIELGKQARENKAAAGGDGSGVENNLIDFGNLAFSYLRGQRNISGLKETSETLEKTNETEQEIIEEFDKIKREAEVELEKITAQRAAKEAELGLVSNTEGNRQRLLTNTNRSNVQSAFDKKQADEDKRVAQEMERKMREQAKEQADEERRKAKLETERDRIGNTVSKVGRDAIGIAGSVGNQPEVDALLAKMDEGRDGWSGQEVAGMFKLISGMDSFVDKTIGKQSQFLSDLSTVMKKIDTMDRKLQAINNKR